MASLRQIEANRRNALKSTGPRSEEGRRKSRNNALKHGITCAVHVPLRHEDEDDLLEIRERMYAAWDPANDKESLQLEVVISQFMNMRRAERLETNFYDQAMAAKQQTHGVPLETSWNDDFGIGMIMAMKENERALKLIDRYTRRAHRLYSEAVRVLEAMQKERRRHQDRRDRQNGHDRRERREISQSKSGTAGITLLPGQPHDPQPEMGSFCTKIESAIEQPEILQRR